MCQQAKRLVCGLCNQYTIEWVGMVQREGFRGGCMGSGYGEFNVTGFAEQFIGLFARNGHITTSEPVFDRNLPHGCSTEVNHRLRRENILSRHFREAVTVSQSPECDLSVEQ